MRPIVCFDVCTDLNGRIDGYRAYVVRFDKKLDRKPMKGVGYGPTPLEAVSQLVVHQAMIAEKELM